MNNKYYLLSTIADYIKKSPCLFLFCVLLLINPDIKAQNGVHVKMKMHVETAAAAIITDFDMFFSKYGVRTEINTASNSETKQKIISIIQKGTYKIITLDEQSKSYMELVPIIKRDTIEPIIKKIGSEKIKSYNCARIIIENKDGSSLELWNTKEIKHYKQYNRLINLSQNIDSKKQDEALANIGLDGFPVRTKYKSKLVNLTFELESIEQEKISDSMYLIPSDYTIMPNIIVPGQFTPEYLNKKSFEEIDSIIQEILEFNEIEVD